MYKFRVAACVFVLSFISVIFTNSSPVSASFSGGNGQIVYQKWSSAVEPSGEYKNLDSNIYVSNQDGSNEQKQEYLSSIANSDSDNFKISPDGEHVVYSERMQNDSSGSYLIVSKLDGSDKHTVYGGYFIKNPRFLSNGNTIAFDQCGTSGQCQYVFTVNTDGSNLKQIVQSGYGSLSPDGDKYVVNRSDSSVNNSTIGFVSDLDGNNPNKAFVDIYSTPGRCTNSCLSTPAWSPDNTRIAFWKYVDLDTYKLVIMNTSTLSVSEYQYNGRPLYNTAWSPDGQQILFTSDNGAIKPYYGWPYNPKLLSFNTAASSFTVRDTIRPAKVLDWRPVGNQNTTTFPTITLSNIYRFYSPSVQRHLFTADENEYNSIRTNYPKEIWAYESVAFKVNGTTNCGVNRSVYRFYSEQLKTHLYTMDENEKTTIQQQFPPEVWRYEGIAFCADKQQLSGTNPVFRFYSERFKTHLYTMDQNEANYISLHYSRDVYRAEGIAYYAY